MRSEWGSCVDLRATPMQPVMAPSLKALVLTFDRNRAVTRHMIARYEAAWPEHPFTFIVPCQDKDSAPSLPRCEFIASPPGIKLTMQALLEGLPDEEWVYWCIDDKYPLGLDLARIAPLVSAILGGGLEGVDGVLFCRARRMLEPAFLTDDRTTVAGEPVLGRRGYQQIWVHQFLRVKVLRWLFDALPDVLEPAKIMDPLKDRLQKPDGHRLFVTETNLAVFAESMRGGVITADCVESMRAHAIPVPEWQPGTAPKSFPIGLAPAEGIASRQPNGVD